MRTAEQMGVIPVERLSRVERGLIIEIVQILDYPENIDRLLLAATLAEQWLNKAKN